LRKLWKADKQAISVYAECQWELLNSGDVDEVHWVCMFQDREVRRRYDKRLRDWHLRRGCECLECGSPVVRLKWVRETFCNEECKRAFYSLTMSTPGPSMVLRVIPIKGYQPSVEEMELATSHLEARDGGRSEQWERLRVLLTTGKLPCSTPLPRIEFTPEVMQAANEYQGYLDSWMHMVAESKFTEGARPKPKYKSKTFEQRKAQAKRLLEESYYRLHLLLEPLPLLKDKCRTVQTRITPDTVDLSDRPKVPDPTNLELTRPQVTRKVGNSAHVKTNFCDKCGDYVYQNHEHPQEQAATV